MDLIWLLVGTLIFVALIGGYFQIMLFANVKKVSYKTLFFGGWVLNPDALNEKGKIYRKLIFACWGTIIFIVFAIESLR